MKHVLFMFTYFLYFYFCYFYRCTLSFDAPLDLYTVTHFSFDLGPR